MGNVGLRSQGDRSARREAGKPSVAATVAESVTATTESTTATSGRGGGLVPAVAVLEDRLTAVQSGLEVGVGARVAGLVDRGASPAHFGDAFADRRLVEVARRDVGGDGLGLAEPAVRPAVDRQFGGRLEVAV